MFYQRDWLLGPQALNTIHCRQSVVAGRNLYLYLYTIFDQRRLDIIDQVEHGRSPQQVTHLPPVWDLLLPLA